MANGNGINFTITANDDAFRQAMRRMQKEASSTAESIAASFEASSARTALASGPVAMKRTCAAPRCNVTFTAVTGPAGGGGALQRYCCLECKNAAYRRRCRERRERGEVVKALAVSR